jgi:hypothetical protein
VLTLAVDVAHLVELPLRDVLAAMQQARRSSGHEQGELLYSNTALAGALHASEGRRAEVPIVRAMWGARRPVLTGIDWNFTYVAPVSGPESERGELHWRPPLSHRAGPTAGR